MQIPCDSENAYATFDEVGFDKRSEGDTCTECRAT